MEPSRDLCMEAIWGKRLKGAKSQINPSRKRDTSFKNKPFGALARQSLFHPSQAQEYR